MHTFKKIACVAALLFATATSAFAADGTVVTNALNIRAESNTNSLILSTAYNGQVLNILSKENSFYKDVQYDQSCIFRY